MAVTRPKLYMIEDLKTLGSHICGYVDDKKNRKKLIELIRDTKNVSYWDYYTNRRYFLERFKQIDQCLGELKSIYEADQYSKERSDMYDAAWLKALLRFFENERTDQAFRPGVKVLQFVLQQFGKYDTEEGDIPLGYPMRVLLVQFRAKTETQIVEYNNAALQKERLKADLAKMKQARVEQEEEKPIVKSYIAPARRKLGEEFDDVRKLATEIYRHPKMPGDVGTTTPEAPLTPNKVEEILGPPPSEPPPPPPAPTAPKKIEVKVPKLLPKNNALLLMEEIRKHRRFQEIKSEPVVDCGVTVSP